MKFFTTKLNLPNLKKPSAKELIKLAYGNQGDNLQPPNLPSEVDFKEVKKPRQIENIIDDILNQNENNISLLECIYCFYNKEKWDQNHPEKSQFTSQLIWQIATKRKEIKLRLFWRLVMFYFTQDTQILAQSLAETFDSFNPTKSDDKLTVKIINFLKPPHSYNCIAEICFSKNLFPEELLKRQFLPYNIKIDNNINLIDKILIYIPNAFANTPQKNDKKVNFLLNCLGKISHNNQLTAIENLLNQVSPNIGGNFPNLVNWLKNNYGLTSDNSRWNELSHNAKIALRKWIGAVNYGDFEKLVDLIIELLFLEYWEINQLKSRKVFWSNYTDRFERIRILLPSSSVKALKDYINTEDITEINDNIEETEICIFDFNEWFIVEFFRGKGSETRIFPKTNELDNLFFNSNDISVEKLRTLPISIENVHDHKFCWQNYCEKLLRQKNILPNKGIKYFKITENQRGFNYSFDSGMPPLREDEIEDRNRQLYHWRTDIRELEQEAKMKTKDRI